MRAMRLLARDWQSGGLIGCLLAVCLQVQAIAAGLPLGPVGDGTTFVICTLHSAATLPDGKDGPGDGGHNHDCCSAFCRSAGGGQPTLPVIALSVIAPTGYVVPIPRRVVVATRRPIGLAPSPRGPPFPPERRPETRRAVGPPYLPFVPAENIRCVCLSA